MHASRVLLSLTCEGVGRIFLSSALNHNLLSPSYRWKERLICGWVREWVGKWLGTVWGSGDTVYCCYCLVRVVAPSVSSFCGVCGCYRYCLFSACQSEFSVVCAPRCYV